MNKPLSNDTVNKSAPFSYTIPLENIERQNRKVARAEELGIKLFVLDGDDDESELQRLEDDIVYNYILMDLDVPEDLKAKYLKLKKELSYNTSYSVSPENWESFQRQNKRAEELGIDLYVLDGDDDESELQHLEDDIVYNYILMDLDVPEELKAKYLKLKEEVNANKTLA